MKEFEAFLQTSIPGMKLTISELFSAVVTLLVCLLVIRVVMKLLLSLIHICSAKSRPRAAAAEQGGEVLPTGRLWRGRGRRDGCDHEMSPAHDRLTY